MAKKITDIEKFSREMALPSQYDFDSIIITTRCYIYSLGKDYFNIEIPIFISFLVINIRKYIQNISSKCSMC